MKELSWTPPDIDTDRLILGDMPGDRVRIDDSHVARANVAFPYVLERLRSGGDDRLVVAVHGGSGVGKSEIGSLLAWYCREKGYPAYVMSGDNYPRRCPEQNDAERLNRYRSAGLAALARDVAFSDEADASIRDEWPEMADADPSRAAEDRAFAVYQSAGRSALEAYLGTDEEIDFDLVNAVIARFKAGAASIPLKRMGRTPENVRYEAVDFSGVRVLVLEWTHGSNPLLRGVDVPIFLYSSPEETLAHRRSRGRDAHTDSSFVQLVLEIEQKRLDARAGTAEVIIRKDGSLLPASFFGVVR